MSAIGGRFNTEECTYWVPQSTNSLYGTTYGKPQRVACSYKLGGKTTRDVNGEEFQPLTTIYTTKEIPRGALVVLSCSNEQTPPDSAETVRASHTATPIRGKKDWTMMTG